MKKIKKILAVMLVLAMSMALAAGCSSKSKQTMFSIMKDAGSMTHYSYDVDMKLESSISGLENLALKFTGKTDGEAMTMGVKVSYSFVTVDVDDFITVTKDAMYVDVQTLFEKLAPMLLGSSYSLDDFESEFGVELKCIKVPLVEGLVNLSSSEELVNTYVSILESAFKDIKITDEKGTFTASVDGATELSKVADAFITALLDNQDTLLAELDKNSVSEAKIKELFNIYVDEVVKGIEKFNTDYSMGLTDSDIADLKTEAADAIDDVLADADFENTSDVYKEAFDELKNSKDDVVSEIADYKDGTARFDITNNLTGKEGSRVYTCTFDLTAENTNTDEDIQLNINSVMTEDNNISVTVPESFTEISDIVYAALVYAYENDMIGDLLDGSIADDLPIGSDTGLDVSDAGQDVYDGVVTLSDYWTDNTVTIEYDKDLVYVNTDDSDIEYGSVCFDAVGDSSCYLFLSYNTDYTVDSFYDYYTKEYYNDPEAYDEVTSTELTSRELSTGVTVYEFDISYRYKDTDGSFDEHYFLVEAETGVVAGMIDKEIDLTDGEILPYEDFLNAVFVNVY